MRKVLGVPDRKAGGGGMTGYQSKKAMANESPPPPWPFPPPTGALPWTKQEERDYQQQKRDQWPNSPF